MDSLLLLGQFWDYKLVSLAGQDIAMSNILLACLLFAILLYYNKKLAQKLEDLISSRIKGDRSHAIFIAKLVRFTLLFIAFLLVLMVANVPLTIFAFAGGAISIAVGFSAKDIINNFISGVIILVNKPIKIGDKVKMAMYEGEITKIDLRYTTITTESNLDILIPNTKVLQADITNWNNPNYLVKGMLEISVPKSLDIRDIMQLANDVMTQSPLTQDRKFEVYLHAFNNVSYDFIIYYYFSRTKTNLKEVSHNINLLLDKKFQKHKIEVNSLKHSLVK